MGTATDEPLSVLLVEDNEIDVEITKHALKRSGANVDLRVARDGEEALDMLSADRPAAAHDTLPRLLLLDLRLPGIDGWELLRRIKDDPELCTIPVAVLTGMSEDQLELECMELGSNLYFVKPMQVSDLSTLVPAIRKYWEIIESLRQFSSAQAA